MLMKPDETSVDERERTSTLQRIGKGSIGICEPYGKAATTERRPTIKLDKCLSGRFRWEQFNARAHQPAQLTPKSRIEGGKEPDPQLCQIRANFKGRKPYPQFSEIRAEFKKKESQGSSFSNSWGPFVKPFIFYFSFPIGVYTDDLSRNFLL